MDDGKRGSKENKNEGSKFTELKRIETLDKKRLPGYWAKLMKNKR